MKREYFLVVAILLIIASGIAWRQTRTTDSPLNSLTWSKNAPSFIVQKNASKDQYTGPMLIRLRDGKDQFISGDWSLNFSGADLFGYGNFAKSTSTFSATSTNIFSTSTGPYVMRIDDKAIAVIEMKNLPKTFDGGSTSLSGSYIGVHTTDEKVPFCVIETTEDRNNRTYDPIPVSKDDRISWSPTSDHELIISSPTGSISSIDLWEMKKIAVSEIDNQKRYKQLATAFQATQPDPHIQRWGNLLAVQLKDGWKAFRIPSTAHVSFLSDHEHLLIKEKNKLSLLEVSTRKLAPLFTQNEIGDKEILTRNSDVRSL